MNKYERVIKELSKDKESSMKVFGHSMEPIIYTGSKLTYKSYETYSVDDIVFCKVKGRFIDAHKITAIKGKDEKKKYMIANNHGFENGWTQTIYGKVIKINKDNND